MSWTFNEGAPREPRGGSEVPRQVMDAATEAAYETARARGVRTPSYSVIEAIVIAAADAAEEIVRKRGDGCQGFEEGK